eukprot:Hpha_TRINITY_DN15777_c1_g2::TRINITY_DN15777_c1_g2_i1::g.40294::m.40294
MTTTDYCDYMFREWCVPSGVFMCTSPHPPQVPQTKFPLPPGGGGGQFPPLPKGFGGGSFSADVFGSPMLAALLPWQLSTQDLNVRGKVGSITQPPKKKK